MPDVIFGVRRGKTLVTDGWGADSRRETDNEMYLRVNRKFQGWLEKFGGGKGNSSSTPLIRHIDYLATPDDKTGKNELIMRISYDPLAIDDGVMESFSDDEDEEDCDQDDLGVGDEDDSWDAIGK